MKSAQVMNFAMFVTSALFSNSAMVFKSIPTVGAVSKNFAVFLLWSLPEAEVPTEIIQSTRVPELTANTRMFGVR